MTATVNTADVMRAAWADYRRDAQRGWMTKTAGFNRAHFAYCLRFAWSVARDRAERAAREAAAAAAKAETIAIALAAPVDPRVAALDAELLGMQMADFLDWPAYNALLVERDRLARQAA